MAQLQRHHIQPILCWTLCFFPLSKTGWAGQLWQLNKHIYFVAIFGSLVCDFALFSSGRVVLNQLMVSVWAGPMFTGLTIHYGVGVAAHVHVGWNVRVRGRSSPSFGNGKCVSVQMNGPCMTRREDWQCKVLSFTDLHQHLHVHQHCSEWEYLHSCALIHVSSCATCMWKRSVHLWA